MDTGVPSTNTGSAAGAMSPGASAGISPLGATEVPSLDSTFGALLIGSFVSVV